MAWVVPVLADRAHMNDHTLKSWEVLGQCAQEGTTQATLMRRREKKLRRILQPCLLFCATNLVHDFYHSIALRLILLEH